MLNFTVKDSTAHHYATIISQDNSDYITIEGFAKKNYAGVDDTWEFLCMDILIPLPNKHLRIIRK